MGSGPGNRPELGRCPPSPVVAAFLTTFVPAPACARRPELGDKPSPVPGEKENERKRGRERETDRQREDRELALEVLWGSL